MHSFLLYISIRVDGIILILMPTIYDNIIKLPFTTILQRGIMGFMKVSPKLYSSN